MDRCGKRCVLYSRVSTEMQVDGFSLAGQKTCLTNFAKREEMKIVSEYEDAGKSGKSIEGRPAFKRMIEDIQNGLKIDYIIVYKLSRFGRNAADVLNSLELIQDYGVNLICTDEGIDSSQASGRLLISVLSAVAQIERENILEQTMNGRREKARQGLWNGGFAPYGYTLVDGKVTIVPEQAEIVKTIFEKYVNEGMGASVISKYLNEQGLFKKSDEGLNHRWSRSAVAYIIANPIYAGKLAYGRRQMSKVKGSKDRKRRYVNNDVIIADGQHDAIITEETFNKASKIREKNAEIVKINFQHIQPHPLTGLIKCPHCGGSMSITGHKSRVTNETIFYYRCVNSKNANKNFCAYGTRYKEEYIEELIDNIIPSLVNNESFINDLKACLNDNSDNDKALKELKNYEETLKRINQSRTLLEHQMDFEIDPNDKRREIIKGRLNELYSSMFDIEEKIEELRLKTNAGSQEKIDVSEIKEIINNFSSVLKVVSREEKKIIYQSLFDEIKLVPRFKDTDTYKIKSIRFKFPLYVNSFKASKDNYMFYEFETDNTVQEIKPVISKLNQYSSNDVIGTNVIDYIYKSYNQTISKNMYYATKKYITALIANEYTEIDIKFLKSKCPSSKNIDYIIDALIDLDILPSNAKEVLSGKEILNDGERNIILKKLDYNRDQLRRYCRYNQERVVPRKITYNDIANYIKEQYNLSVSHRAITYTAILFGLKKQEEETQINYKILSVNAFKKILEAYKHFKLISNDVDYNEIIEVIKCKKKRISV